MAELSVVFVIASTHTHIPQCEVNDHNWKVSLGRGQHWFHLSPVSSWYST
jgi:hypothetical protein